MSRADSSLGVIFRGSSSGMLVRIAGLGVGFLAQLFLARILLAEEYSRYIYVLTWLNVLTLFGKAGLDTAALRFVAALHGSGEPGKLRGFLRTSTIAGLLASLVVTAGTAAVISTLSGRLAQSLAAAFLIGALVVPVNSLLAIRSAVLQAFKRVARAEFPQSVARPVLTVAGAALLFLVFDQAPTAGWAMIAYLAAGVLAVLLVQGLLRPILVPAINGASPEYETGTWIRTSLPLLLISGFYLILSQTDTLMLGVLRTTDEAGAYAVASRITQLIFLGQWAVNAIVAPMIAEHHHRKESDKVQAVATYAARLAFGITVPLAAAVILFGRPILALFSTEFTVAWEALAILGAGMILNVLSGSVGLLMTMTGHQKEASRVLGTAALLNIVLNVVLIPMYGMIGAAFATAFTTVLWNIALVVLVRKRLGIHPTMLGR
jgi:O-antigen/teichoic acid export membrane protein